MLAFILLLLLFGYTLWLLANHQEWGKYKLYIKECNIVFVCQKIKKMDCASYILTFAAVKH